MAYIHYNSARESAKLIRLKEISPVELMEETLNRIRAVNPAINAFVSLRADKALSEAEMLTERILSGETIGPLAGIPIGVKDMEDVEGMVTSYGAVPYKDNLVLQDSIQVARLKAAGAIVVGKTNTPEFAFTFFTKNRLHGVTRNPWNTEFTPGGSSGGSAAAVAGGMIPLATGSDGGGSIRIPAAYSGCFGIKPSTGRIPMENFPGPTISLPLHPLVALGPLTRTVEDAALFMDCVSGYHPCDPLSLPAPAQSYTETLGKLPASLRIAFSPGLGYARVQRDVMTQVEEAVKCFEDLGHHVELWEMALPDVGEAWSKLIYCDFLSQLCHDLDNNRPELSKSLVAILEGARSMSLMDLVEALRVKTELNRLLWDLFSRFDLLLTPTVPTEAFAANGPPPNEIDGHPISLFGAVAFTYPFNLSGHPAASVPAGLTDNGLPAGLQIIAPHHRDDLVLQASYAYEQVRPWKEKRPMI